MAGIAHGSARAAILTTCQPSWVICVQGGLFHRPVGSVGIDVPALFVRLSLVLGTHKAIATRLPTGTAGSRPHTAFLPLTSEIPPVAMRVLVFMSSLPPLIPREAEKEEAGATHILGPSSKTPRLPCLGPARSGWSFSPLSTDLKIKKSRTVKNKQSGPLSFHAATCPS